MSQLNLQLEPSVSHGAQAPVAEGVEPSAPPPLHRKVQEVAYLTADNVTRYRMILRFFFEQYEQQHDWISGEQIQTYMQKHYDPAYQESDREQDLKFLVEKRNLIPEQDRGRARTVEEFRHRKLVYHVTPVTVAFETMLRSLERSTGDKGSLDSTLLERLWSMLDHLRRRFEDADSLRLSPTETVHRHPGASPAHLSPEQVASELRRPWLDAVNYFETLRSSANAFHHSLREARPADLMETEAFLTYKGVLVKNLEGFINQLQLCVDRVRALLLQWTEQGIPQKLIAILSDYEASHMPGPDGLPEWKVCCARFTQQYVALEEWFRRGGGSDVLKRTTAAAIETVVLHTQRLVDRHRMGMSRRRDLERLAQAFANCDSLEDAHRLAARTLGCATPRHIQGVAAWHEMTDAAPVWSQPPQEVPLRRIRRGSYSRHASEPVRDRTAEQLRVLQQEERRRVQESARWDKLFAGGIIDLGAIVVPDSELRRRVLDVVGRCLVAPDRTVLASDGSRIELLLPAPGSPPGELSAPDGVWITPRYHLRRIREETS